VFVCFLLIVGILVIIVIGSLFFSCDTFRGLLLTRRFFIGSVVLLIVGSIIIFKEGEGTKNALGTRANSGDS